MGGARVERPPHRHAQSAVVLLGPGYQGLRHRVFVSSPLAQLILRLGLALTSVTSGPGAFDSDTRQFSLYERALSDTYQYVNWQKFQGTTIRYVLLALVLTVLTYILTGVTYVHEYDERALDPPPLGPEDLFIRMRLRGKGDRKTLKVRRKKCDMILPSRPSDPRMWPCFTARPSREFMCFKLHRSLCSLPC